MYDSSVTGNDQVNYVTGTTNFTYRSPVTGEIMNYVTGTTNFTYRSPVTGEIMNYDAVTNQQSVLVENQTFVSLYFFFYLIDV